MNRTMIAVMLAVVLVCGALPACAEVVFAAQWEGGSYDADINRDGGGHVTWGMGPYGAIENVNLVAKGIHGRMAVDATDEDARCRYYVGDQSDAGTYLVLFKLDGWVLANGGIGYYLGGLNSYSGTNGTSVRDQGTFVRAYESTGSSPYVQPGGAVLEDSEWMLMAYSYDVDANDMNGASRLHLLDAFSGEGHSSGVAIGYGGDVFDLLTVGNAGAPDGGVQMGFSIHGWIDEV